MDERATAPDITRDDLSGYAGGARVFVTFGETMVRDTPSDLQRPELSREVHISLAGSEFNIAVLLGRLGVPSGYVTRVPDNPYGWMLRDTARANGVDMGHAVWAPRAEPMGRYFYEPGRTPRAGVVWYQRMYSAASRLGPGMVDWRAALAGCRLFHASGITFGLASHSGYADNPPLAAFREAMAARPAGCLVDVDFNYRATLWTEAECTAVLTPLIEDHADILITSVYDMARHYGMGCGRYSARAVLDGEARDLHDDDLRAWGDAVTRRFDLALVALTMRHSDSAEQHRWESAAIGRAGEYFRSPAPRPILLQDRIGGGDAWDGGFFYGLLTRGITQAGVETGVLVGDAATRLKQTLMFDLPILRREEIQALLATDAAGATQYTVR